jgi:hypothetical protein
MGAGSGRSPGEQKYFEVAAKIAGLLGQDPERFWANTKQTYMNPERNGTANIYQALDRQADDVLWGDVAFRRGILTGDKDHDNQVWIDHYNAHGNMQYDPMVGHNDSIAEYMASRDALEQATADQYPDWYNQP